MTSGKGQDDALAVFTRAAEQTASHVIRTYSTSFGLATRLLGTRHRQHVRNIYAMVRIADEIVDGVATQAGLAAEAQAAALTAYATEAHHAIRSGYSTDMVLHAFGRTARTTGIDSSLTEPFFASMHADLPAVGDGLRGGGLTAYDDDARRRYVYGSAEVVGLMCLRVFLHGERRSAGEVEILEHGARQLGAAFQNVNFLRDLADDTGRLRRDYLAGAGSLTDADRDSWVATVRGQLQDARRSIPLLPRDCRAAVRSAHDLFAALTHRLSKTPAVVLSHRRVCVADPVKLGIIARSVVGTAWDRRS